MIGYCVNLYWFVFTGSEDPRPPSEKQFLLSGPLDALVWLVKQTYLLSLEVDLEAYVKL